MSEAKKSSNFFKDIRRVPVNPAHRVLPSMPPIPSRQSELRLGRFGNPVPILAIRGTLSTLSQHGYLERRRAMRPARSKFRFICLASVSIQETKHRGTAHEVLLGPF
jgi:hypothetical protein